MKKVMVILCLVALPATIPAQKYPEVTEAGKKAAIDLLTLCHKAGALKTVTDARSNLRYLLVADQAKPEEVVQNQREKFTPAVRDALLSQHQQPGVVALLLVLGQETKDDRVVAFARLFSAQSLKRDLKHREARQHFEAAVKLFQGLRMKDWQAFALQQLSQVCKAQGDLAHSSKLFETSLGLFKQVHGDRHPHVATALNNLADVCSALGDLPRARNLHEQALALYKQLYGGTHPLVAGSLNNLAGICLDQGDLPQARRLLEQAVDLSRKLHGEKHPLVAVSLNNIAAVCQAQRDFPEARKLCEQVLGLRRELLGDRHPEVANSLNNLAEVCRQQGDLPRARKLHEQALALQKELSGDRHPDVASSLNNLARVCEAQGDLNRAFSHMESGVLACRLPQARGKKVADLLADDFRCSAETVRQVRSLASLLRSTLSKNDTGRAREASQAYTLAADLLDRLRAEEVLQTEGKLDQGAREAGLVFARVGLAAVLFQREGKVEDLHLAFSAIEQGRARVFLEGLARLRSHQLGGVPAALAQRQRDLESHLRGIQGGIDKENAKTLEQRNAKLVEHLYDELKRKREDLEMFAAELRQKYPQYGALRYPRPCTLQQARNTLGDNEAAVLFALDANESFAVIVHKKPAPEDKREGVVVVKLPGANVLASKVRTLVDREVLRSDSRCRRLGTELYDLLLKPLAEHVQGKHLVIAPDGVLWELPFELLVEGATAEQDGKYLIQTRQIRYTSSMTVLHLIDLWEKSRPAPSETLWALADPIFDRNDPRAKGDLHKETKQLLESYALRHRGGGAVFPRLLATRTEVQALADLHRVSKQDVVTDGLASETVIKAASKDGILGRKRYVHLATHGLLSATKFRQPSLVLSLVGNDLKEEGGGDNDGFLTLTEVTHLKLNADLVVLSACETGKGDLKAGEGVIGLSRAFLYAGSRGVVCSLWHVDDEQTARLMQGMYVHLKDGKSSAEALALARRKLIAEEQAPLYWAPFILIGK